MKQQKWAKGIFKFNIYRQFHTGMHKPKTNTEQDEFRPWKTWRSEQKQPLFKIIDDYDPFDEPETSIAQSMKTKISTRFNEKMTHKEKWESIRRTTHSSWSKRRNLNIPLTNSKTIASLQAEFSDNISNIIL